MVGILGQMGKPPTLLLFEPDVQPQSWNERMAPGEYAVLYSHHEAAAATDPEVAAKGAPFCTVHGSLADAEEYAARQVAAIPSLRCRIYDNQGLGAAPVREIRGSEHKGESEMSARFRRWAGSVLFFGGLGLTILDWSTDFKLGWPAMVGTRMLPVGLVLLVIEAGIAAEAKRTKHRAERETGERR